MTRERDSKGRFVKRRPATTVDENDSIHQLTREFNRIADGGHEPTIEDARREELLVQFSLHALGVAFALFLLYLLLRGCSA